MTQPMRGGSVTRLATLEGSLFNVALSISGVAGDKTLYATPAGVLFGVYALFLRSSGDETLTFKSASTALSGAIPLTFTERLELHFNGVPWMVGKAKGDDWIVTTTAGSINVVGFALVAHMHHVPAG